MEKLAYLCRKGVFCQVKLILGCDGKVAHLFKRLILFAVLFTQLKLGVNESRQFLVNGFGQSFEHCGRN